MKYFNRTHSIAAIFFSFFTIISCVCKGQSNILDRKLDSLKYVSINALDCNSVFWQIVGCRRDAIQMLVEKISDSTLTSAVYKCKEKNLTVGDLSYLALDMIIPLPFFKITGIQADHLIEGCRKEIFIYLDENRKVFQSQIMQWVDKETPHIQWENFKESELSDCDKKNKITGHYVIRH